MAEQSSYIASHRIFQFHNILTKPFLILYRPVNNQTYLIKSLFICQSPFPDNSRNISNNIDYFILVF